jgi:S-formylglutathione hydrolase FrmB
VRRLRPYTLPVTNPDAGEGLSRRSLLQALGLAPLAIALPVATQALTATPAVAATYPSDAGTFTSTYTRLAHNWTLTYPDGHTADDHLPVALALHSSNGDATEMLGLGFPERLDALISAGKTPPFALASIDSMNGFYEKKGSRDYGKVVSVEFLKLLADRGLNTSRLGIIGWSMGGWGAFRLAQHELHGKVRVISAISTPCYSSWKTWPSYEHGDMTKSQFTANNFYHHPGLLAKPRIYIFCGKSDGFYKGNKAFAKVLDKARGVRKPKTHFSSGGHTRHYWQSVLDPALTHIGRYI